MVSCWNEWVFMAWVKKLKLFRPRSLLRYMAVSALRTKVSGSVPSSG